MKVTVQLNDAQWRVVREALDLYSRLLAGQVSMVDEVLRAHLEDVPEHESARDALVQFKRVWFPAAPYNGNMGITHPALSEEARVAYEIAASLERAAAWHQKPEGGSGVNFREPLRVSEQALPVVAVEDD